MKEELERNLGEQPLTKILTDRELKARDLVAASSEQIAARPGSPSARTDSAAAAVS